MADSAINTSSLTLISQWCYVNIVKLSTVLYMVKHQLHYQNPHVLKYWFKKVSCHLVNSALFPFSMLSAK